ncbi:DUF2946 family protein [Rhodoferax sp. TS-BS-61-7]|uniref:DUF2946 family protein n=1 Tax=Rhodoferax sp. TS-BS-61-7 TaxID=2094194 RepID=UPI000CF71831|nr:DUF2946 family protein [Rhodoferax sp. TS-BS-61-7]PQA76968.1 DUF2946 domain-containing protein [Rhodoferax sp. TS-BS-61-7]
MSPLQTLRQAHALIRWMLACFVLAMGVAVAAPVVNPQALSLVCSAGGSVKLVVQDDAGGSAPMALAHTLDCVMCLPAGAPPASTAAALPLQTLGEVLRALAPQAVTWRTAAPASARGPPHTA